MIRSSCLVCGTRIPAGTSRCEDHAKQRHAIAGSCVTCGAPSHFLYCDLHRPIVVEADRADYRKAYRDPGYHREAQAAKTRSRGRCERCGGPPPLEVDHILPLRDGGTNARGNLQVLCVPCHAAKTRLDRARRDR